MSVWRATGVVVSTLLGVISFNALHRRLRLIGGDHRPLAVRFVPISSLRRPQTGGTLPRHSIPTSWRISTFVVTLKPLCAAILIMLCGIRAQGQSHIPEPFVNLGDSSFLDAEAGPGFLVEQFEDISHYGRIANAIGQTVPGTSSVNSIGGITHVAWITHRRILGALYGIELLPVEAYVDAGAQGRRGGFGDLTVSPVILQWSKHWLFSIPIDQRFDLDLVIPMGKYSRTPGVNLGLNAYSVHPYYTITVLPTKRIETSWRINYLWNATNNSPPLSTQARSVQAGQAIHFNGTVGFKAYKSLWIGPNGYYLAQISDGRINGVPLHNSPEQVGAIGLGMVWFGERRRFLPTSMTSSEQGIDQQVRKSSCGLRGSSDHSIADNVM
jgi:hypothetical protein